jgi:hypothetical protein
MKHPVLQLLILAALALPFVAAHAQTAQQTPQQIVQQVVDSERAANQADHSQWIYLQDNRKPKVHLVQWVASTPHGAVCRVLARDGRELPEPEQRTEIDKFLHDIHAQNKEIAENKHDLQQVDDFLKLLPQAFVWTETARTDSSTTLHFEPDPHFHPPNREARVFAGMSGDLVADNQQRRIHKMSGRLIHDVAFGGGLLGRLKQGSSFAIEQEPVGEGFWELTIVHVHLQGNALLFHSVSLEQEDQRSHFGPEPEDITLDQAATKVMRQPATPPLQSSTTGSK